MKSYKDVIGLWPSPMDLAVDAGKTAEQVRKWISRSWIPPSSWPDVAEAAARRKYPVDLQLLASLRKSKSRKARA